MTRSLTFRVNTSSTDTGHLIRSTSRCASAFVHNAMVHYRRSDMLDCKAYDILGHVKLYHQYRGTFATGP